jgi:hypothetical protein
MMTLLTETSSAITQPLVKLLNSSVEVIPGLVAAILILLVAYLFAVFIGTIVRRTLVKLTLLKKYFDHTSVMTVVSNYDLAGFFGVIVKWYVFILFLPATADLIRLPALSDFLLAVSLWVPKLIVALIIALIGFLGAQYVEVMIKATKGKVSELVASGAKYVISIFVAIVALEQVGVDVSLAENSFLIVLAGVMLAIGLAFGLGARDEAKAAFKKLKKNL